VFALGGASRTPGPQVFADLTEAPGDLLVAVAYCACAALPAISDTDGNKWLSTAVADTGHGALAQIWYAANVVGTVDGRTDTVTFPSVTGPSPALGAFLLEYSGLAKVDPFDNASFGVSVQPSTAQLTPGSFSRANSGDLIVTLFFTPYMTPSVGTLVLGPGLTAETTDTFLGATLADNPPYTTPAGSDPMTASLLGPDGGALVGNGISLTLSAAFKHD
jgi:hypothetical protein